MNVFLNKAKYAIGMVYLLLCNAAYAMSTNMPGEVKNKTDDMESLIVWAITIGGAVVIGLCFWAIHKNKGQGGWIEYVAWSLIGLAMFGVLITWWWAKAKTATAGFMF
jgi:hypothetical protein